MLSSVVDVQSGRTSGREPSTNSGSRGAILGLPVEALFELALEEPGTGKEDFTGKDMMENMEKNARKQTLP